jgi:hypothetical protein
MEADGDDSGQCRSSRRATLRERRQRLCCEERGDEAIPIDVIEIAPAPCSSE